MAKKIQCHLSRLMGERKLKVIDVARMTGLHRNTITLLYEETAVRVDLETIEKLCEMFDVKVGELFEYVPDGTTKKSSRRSSP
jgi:putative transcriptional regulator